MRADLAGYTVRDDFPPTHPRRRRVRRRPPPLRALPPDPGGSDRGAAAGHGHRGGRGPAPRQLHAPARRDALHPDRRRRRIYRQRGPRGGDPDAGIGEPRRRPPLPSAAAEREPRGPAACGRRHAPHPGADAGRPGQDARPPRRRRAVHRPEQLRRDRPLRNPHRADDAGEPVPARRHAGPPVPVLLRHRRPVRPARGERAGHRGDRRPAFTINRTPVRELQGQGVRREVPAPQGRDVPARRRHRDLRPARDAHLRLPVDRREQADLPLRRLARLRQRPPRHAAAPPAGGRVQDRAVHRPGASGRARPSRSAASSTPRRRGSRCSRSTARSATNARRPTRRSRNISRPPSPPRSISARASSRSSGWKSTRAGSGETRSASPPPSPSTSAARWSRSATRRTWSPSRRPAPRSRTGSPSPSRTSASATSPCRATASPCGSTRRTTGTSSRPAPSRCSSPRSPRSSRRTWSTSGCS